MKLTEELLGGAAEIWEDYHRHPFVKGIADGSLEHKKFQYYMVQDYLYLYEYARVFALGAAKAKDPQDMKLFAGYVSQILNGEMEIHRRYMKRLGISVEEADRTLPALDNLLYTSYMLRIAYEGGAAEIAAAILSCAVSYEVIARRMVEQNPACLQHPFYGEWISSYADPAYAEANRALEALTERLAADSGAEQRKRLVDIFRNCSRCETAFWDMAWEMRS